MQLQRFSSQKRNDDNNTKLAVLFVFRCLATEQISYALVEVSASFRIFALILIVEIFVANTFRWWRGSGGDLKKLPSDASFSKVSRLCFCIVAFDSI